MAKIKLIIAYVLILLVLTSARLANTYTVYFDTDTKVLQGQGTWGEKDGIPDSDGISRLKNLQVAFSSTVTTYFSEDYDLCEHYIDSLNLIFPE
jgi:hypothetical protein